MPNIEGLRGPYVKVGGFFHFARMCDKIRLHSAGKLPEDYFSMLGDGFDGRITRFMRVDYEEVRKLVLDGASDEEALEWCLANGRPLSEEDVMVFNSFISKRGWRDDEEGEHNTQVREEYGVSGDLEIKTDFDLIERDEGRPLDAWKDAWGV